MPTPRAAWRSIIGSVQTECSRFSLPFNVNPHKSHILSPLTNVVGGPKLAETPQKLITILIYFYNLIPATGSTIPSAVAALLVRPPSHKCNISNRIRYPSHNCYPRFVVVAVVVQNTQSEWHSQQPFTYRSHHRFVLGHIWEGEIFGWRVG